MNVDSVRALRDLIDICLCSLDAPQEKHFYLLSKKLSSLTSEEIRQIPVTISEIIHIHTVSLFNAGLFTARFLAIKYRENRNEVLAAVEDMKKCSQVYMRLFFKYFSETDPQINDSWDRFVRTEASARYLYVFLRRIRDNTNAVALVFMCLRKNTFLRENIPEAFSLAEKMGEKNFCSYVLKHFSEFLKLDSRTLQEKKVALYCDQGDYNAIVKELDRLSDIDDPSLQCLLILALKKVGREDDASSLFARISRAKNLSPRLKFQLSLLKSGAKIAFDEMHDSLSKGEKLLTPQSIMRDFIRFSVPLSDLLDLYLEEKVLKGRMASEVLNRYLINLDEDTIYASHITIETLAKISTSPLLNCDDFISRAIAVYYKKDILTFREEMSALSTREKVGSPFFQLFQSWECSLDSTPMRLESYGACTDVQRKIFYLFLLNVGVTAQVFPFMNLYFEGHISQDIIINLYNTSFNSAKFGFCIYLLDQYSTILSKSEKDLVDKKISCFKKMKAFYNIINEIEKLKMKTNENAFDFIYIESLMKCGKYDDAYRVLIEKDEELKKNKKSDIRLHRLFSLYYFHQGEYLAALKHVEAGLTMKPEDRTLLEYKVKLLSYCGLKQEAVTTAKKLFTQRPVQSNFDMMMQMQFEAVDESSAECVIFVNLLGENNIDECMSLALYYLDKLNKNTSFHVSHVVFLIDQEGVWQIPSANIPFTVKMIFDEISFDIIKEACRKFTMDWLGYMHVTHDMLDDIENSLSSFIAHGDREGGIIGKYLSLYRYEAVQNFDIYIKNNDMHLSVDNWLNLFNKYFFIMNNNYKNETKKILFITPRGISDFGGGEQFAMGVASIFEKNNFDIYVIAFSEQFKSSCLYKNNTYFIKNNKNNICNTIYDINPDIVWSFTWDDMKELINSLKYIRAETIIGLHYYRAFFIGDIEGEFSCTANNIVRRSFYDCLRYTDVVYANSIFTQRLILKFFHVALPVMFSLPHKFPLKFAPLEGRNFVLQINTELKKGFDLIVQVAALLPHIPFVALSNQSSIDFAREYCRERGVTNVKVLPFQEDMGKFYSKARVVVVPSYRFLETFSRVPIEAQHFGVPVLGSNTGNVPYLLEQSGTVLPMDKQAWAAEIERLYTDDTYYEQQSQKAFANAQKRYHFGMQSARIEHFSKYCSMRILVAMGSGVGNMVLASVAARKISEHYHTPVDIVTDSVPQSSAMMFANSPYINAVYVKHEMVRRRRYDIVFVTRSYSYGTTYSDFNAEKIYRTRDLFDFIDMRGMHESEMELKSIHHYLNIPYEENDIYNFAICCNPYPPRPVRGRIGFHAGCKPGHWTKKQWPYFAELAVLLREKGYEVVSLGTPEEYIEGTLNDTSYDTWDMVRAIQKCEYIVSNDSGIGHLAKALGIAGTLLVGPTYIAKILPYGEKWDVIHGHVPCMPCCMLSDFTTRECDRACMKSITVKSVLASIEKNISRGVKDTQYGQGEL